MNQDFLTRLELQLSIAERAQERRGRVGRALSRGRDRAPSRAALVGLTAAVAVMAAIVIGVVALNQGGTEQPVGHRAPSVVARVALGDYPRGFAGGVASGSGSVWVVGTDRIQVIRVDSATRRVLARVPLGHPAGVSGVVAGAGVVWAMVVTDYDNYQSELVRIDPASNRVTAHIPLSAGANRVTTAFDAGPVLLADGRAMWVLGSEGGALIDSRRGTVARVVRWNLGGVYADAYALAGGELWVHADDGRLLRFDAGTGARQASVTGPPGKVRLAAAGADVVIGHDDGTVALIDGTGSELWSTRVGVKTGQLTVAGRLVWALSENRGTERLTAIDLTSGRVRGAITLGASSAYALAPVGDALWVITPTGQAVVIRP